MQGTVQEFGTSQKGTPKWKIDGKWYWPHKDLRSNPPQIGQLIEFTSKTFGERNDMLSVESYQAKASSQSNGPRPPAGVSDDAEMRFISNCVGQAIAAKTITTPADITAWARGAKAALKSISNQGSAQDFDDEINF